MTEQPFEDYLWEAMTLERFGQWSREQHWTYAKSMPKWPHWYVAVESVSDPEMFRAAVATIRQYGYWARFFKRRNLHLDLDGWTYWTMGAAIADTRIINAAPTVATLQKATPPPADRIPPRRDIPPRGEA